MRFYRNLFLILVVAAVALFLLKKEASDVGAPPPGGLRATAPATPSASAASSTPAPAPAQADYRRTLEQIARNQRVSIVAYSESAGQVNMTIEWVSDNAATGGDFVDECLKQGIIRDFKDKGATTFIDSSGRRHFRAAFELIMN